MRVLFLYCDEFGWTPAMKTLEEAPDAEPGKESGVVVAFVHVEPKDVEPPGSAETKLVKNSKWLARKWEVNRVVIHSFTHLGEEKADHIPAGALLARVAQRLETAGYEVRTTPWGHFLNLKIDAPGHPLARVFKEF